MGNSSAPAKLFPGPTPFGQSPPSPIATETQPLALNSGTQTPAMSGYNMTLSTPVAPDTSQAGQFGGGDMQALKDQLQAKRTGNGGRPMPFYG